MLYSTSSAKFGESMFQKQVVFSIISIFTATFIQFIDYRRLSKYITLVLSLIVLALIYLSVAHILYKVHIDLNLPFTGGHATKGAFRWIKLGKISLQPSEFLKISLTFFIANYYSRKQRFAKTFWKGFVIPLVLVAGVSTFLVLAGGDLSMTVMITMIVLGTAFVGGIRIRYLCIILVFGVIAFFAISKLSPERLSRLETYQSPEAFAKGSGYQLWLSELAIGSGGKTGTGFTKSRMKEFYLPDAHTDFIVSIVGEELGFIGIVFLIMLYLGVFVSAVGISISAVDNLGIYLGTGMAISFILPALFNIAVVSGYFPTTGITAPLLSYGGSSLLTTFVGIGILLSIARVSIKQSMEDAYSQVVYLKNKNSEHPSIYE